MCSICCCWPKFQSIFNPVNPLQQTTGNHINAKIVFNNNTGPSFLEFNWCKKKFQVLERQQIVCYSPVTLVVKIPLYLEFFSPLIVRCQRGRKFSIQFTPTQLHLRLSLFAPMGETYLRVLTKAWKYLTCDNSTFRECRPL